MLADLRHPATIVLLTALAIGCGLTAVMRITEARAERRARLQAHSERYGVIRHRRTRDGFRMYWDRSEGGKPSLPNDDVVEIVPRRPRISTYDLMEQRLHVQRMRERERATRGHVPRHDDTSEFRKVPADWMPPIGDRRIDNHLEETTDIERFLHRRWWTENDKN